MNGWIQGGSGFYEYVADGSGGHYLQFIRRRYRSDGPRQLLDNTCLTQGMKYYFDAKIKLEYSDGTPFECDNLQQMRSDDFCVDLIFEMRSATGKKWLRFLNGDPAKWSGSKFNTFSFSFEANEMMTAADEVYFTISGVHEDVRILLDDVSIIPQNQRSRTCAQIVNGDAEVSLKNLQI